MKQKVNLLPKVIKITVDGSEPTVEPGQEVQRKISENPNKLLR